LKTCIYSHKSPNLYKDYLAMLFKYNKWVKKSWAKCAKFSFFSPWRYWNINSAD